MAPWALLPSRLWGDTQQPPPITPLPRGGLRFFNSPPPVFLPCQCPHSQHGGPCPALWDPLAWILGLDFPFSVHCRFPIGVGVCVYGAF